MAIRFNREIITSGYNPSKINNNFQRIETALLDGVSRSGKLPNTMEADLDLNSNDLLNVGEIDASSILLEGVPLSATAYHKGDKGDPATPVANRTALKALNTTNYKLAYLQESGRQGLFVWTSGNYSSMVSADTSEGIYIKSDGSTTSSGAWVRSYDGEPNIKWWGAVGDQTTDDTVSVNAAIDFVRAYDKTLFVPVGTYRVTSGYTQSSFGNIRIHGASKFDSVFYLDNTNDTSFFFKSTTTITLRIENLRFRCAQYVLDRKFFWFAAPGAGNSQNFWKDVIFTSVEIPLYFESAALCQSVSMYDVRFDDSGTILMDMPVGNIRTLLTFINVSHDGAVPANTRKVVMDLSGCRMVQGTNLLLEGYLPSSGWTVLELGQTFDGAAQRYPTAEFNGFYSEWPQGPNQPDNIVSQTRGITLWSNSSFGQVGTTSYKYNLNDQALAIIEGTSFLLDTTSAEVFFTRNDTESEVIFRNCNFRVFNYAHPWVRVDDSRLGGTADGRLVTRFEGSIPPPPVFVGTASSTTWVCSTDATYGRKIVVTPGTVYNWRWIIPRGSLTTGDQMWVVLRVKLPTFSTGVLRVAWRENGTIQGALRSFTPTSPELGTVVDLAFPVTVFQSTGDMGLVIDSPSGLPGSLSGLVEVIALEVYNGLSVTPRHRNAYPNATVGYATAAPTTGTWAVGDIIWNTAPPAGGTPGWVCTTAGTPGTWKAMASIAA